MDDLISRKVAIEAFDRIPLPRIKGLGLELLISVSDAKGMLEGMKAVDAAPVKHGRWVDADENPVAWSKALPSSPEDSCICSVCGTWLVGSDELPVYGLYCPACGAKMDLEE